VHVPSLPFLPASTVYSARPLQVCCTLHPIMGFGPFQAPSRAPPRGSTSDLNPPRDRASHPSELSPRLQPYRVTAALAFSPFGRFTSEVPRSQGFSPSPSPLPCPTLPPTTARCSPGLRSPPGFSPNSPSPRRFIAKTRRPRLCLVAEVEPPLSFDMYATCALRRLFRGIR
jgi:hypothetical protein